MDFSKLLSKKEDKDEHEYYWALVIEPFWVQAGIWRIEEENAQIMHSGNPVAWETDNDLSGACDTTLSAAIQNFPEDVPEPTKTVFGVVSSWVEEGQIRQEYLDKIKKICSEMSLKPVGFVVVSEAIANLAKSEEGNALNAIVVGVYKESLEMSVFQLGSLLGNTKVARSISIIDDITEGLSRFSQAVNLPSRFIIYDGREGELEEVKQILFKVNWDDFKDFKFLHTPKVEIVDSKLKIRAISLAGASEMASVRFVKDISGQKEDNAGVSESEVDNLNQEPLKPEDFGFFVGKDVAEKQTARAVGTFSNLDEINNTEKMQFSKENIENIQPVEEVHQEHLTHELDRKNNNRLNFRPKLGLIFGLRKRIILPRIRFISSLLSASKTPFVVGIGTIVILIFGGIIVWWFLSRATLTIYVSPKTLFENFEVSVNPNGISSDIPSATLGAAYISVETAGSKTTSTTGIKTVGEKAAGQVVIYRAGNQLSLPAGTFIKGPDNLQFALDSAILLASGSASTPGATKTNVTAASIGAQYNLASGTSFSVGNFSTADLEAKNESSFSGGSSREISIVSEEDQQKLENDLRNELINDAKKEIKEKSSVDEYVLEESIKDIEKSKKFDAKVGDEASDVKIDLSLEVKSLVVKGEKLRDLSFDFLKDKVPGGFVLKKENISPEFEFKEEVGGIYKFKLSLGANLLPEINVEEIRDKILGRYPEIAYSYLQKTVPGFVKMETKTNFKFPGRLGTLPKVKKNLSIIISAQK